MGASAYQRRLWKKRQGNERSAFGWTFYQIEENGVHVYGLMDRTSGQEGEIEARLEIYPEHHGHLYHLFIPSQFRGRGFGSEIVRMAEKVTLQNGGRFLNVSVGLENGDPSPFLEKLGYKDEHLGREERTSGGPVRMHRRLG